MTPNEQRDTLRPSRDEDLKHENGIGAATTDMSFHRDRYGELGFGLLTTPTATSANDANADSYAPRFQRHKSLFGSFSRCISSFRRHIQCSR